MTVLLWCGLVGIVIGVGARVIFKAAERRRRLAAAERLRHLANRERRLALGIPSDFERVRERLESSPRRRELWLWNNRNRLRRQVVFSEDDVTIEIEVQL